LRPSADSALDPTQISSRIRPGESGPRPAPQLTDLDRARLAHDHIAVRCRGGLNADIVADDDTVAAELAPKLGAGY
jgi:hypothetical protein